MRVQVAYEMRHLCKDPSNCACTCQEDPTATFWKGFGSIALGVAAFTGGVVLTVTTGGLGAVGIAAACGGGALTGLGATAAIHPVAKKMSGERMTGGEYIKDLAIGGTVGAITGPIGVGGASVTTSMASKVGTEGVKQGAVKFGCRTAVGAVSGATASAIQEGVNAASDEKAEFSVVNVLKGTALGALTGGASHITGNIANQVDPGLARSVTKVVSDTVGTVAIDASAQLIVDGKVDGKKLALNAGARAATSAGYEAVASATYKAHGGKEALRDKLGDKQILDDLDPKDQESALKAQQFLEQLSVEEAEKQLQLATKSTDAKRELKVLTDNLEAAKARKAAVDQNIATLKETSSFSREELAREMKPLQDEKNKLNRQIKEHKQLLTKHTTKVLPNVPGPDKLGDQNVHALDSNHIGQFAADLPEDGNNGRGTKRIVFDLKADKEGNSVRYKVAGVTNDHDYSKVAGYGEVQVPELKVVEPFILPKEEDDEDDKKKKN